MFRQHLGRYCSMRDVNWSLIGISIDRIESSKEFGPRGKYADRFGFIEEAQSITEGLISVRLKRDGMGSKIAG